MLAAPTFADVLAARAAHRAVPAADAAVPLSRARRAARHRGLRQAREPSAGRRVQGARRRQPRRAARADERERGVITASTGNHGQSIAFAARLFGVRATICVPEDANPVKVAAMRGARRGGRRPRRATSTTRASTASSSPREHGYRYVHSGNEPHADRRRRAPRRSRSSRNEPGLDVDHRPDRRRQRRGRRLHRRPRRSDPAAR